VRGYDLTNEERKTQKKLRKVAREEKDRRKRMDREMGMVYMG
jgi:hypothetical protein